MQFCLTQKAVLFPTNFRVKALHIFLKAKNTPFFMENQRNPTCQLHRENSVNTQHKKSLDWKRPFICIGLEVLHRFVEGICYTLRKVLYKILFILATRKLTCSSPHSWKEGLGIKPDSIPSFTFLWDEWNGKNRCVENMGSIREHFIFL